MDSTRIIDTLAPFLEGDSLSVDQLSNVSVYLELLMKWNASVSLTSIRGDEAIVARHFGESFFAARKLRLLVSAEASLADLGSGAGFPGIPIKIWIPELRVMLIESRQKKATFLNEVIRTLRSEGIEVSNRRAEQLETQADFVTIRAVEKFERALSIAQRLVRPGGKLILLIGSQQASVAKALLPRFTWEEPHKIPLSSSRIVWIGGAPQ